jgi:hypothetical protein
LGPTKQVPLELNDRERTLILEHTFAHEELTNRLRSVPKPGERPVFRFTLDDLDELAGFVAAEANHAKDKKIGNWIAFLPESTTSWSPTPIKTDTKSTQAHHKSPLFMRRFSLFPLAAPSFKSHLPKICQKS